MSLLCALGFVAACGQQSPASTERQSEQVGVTAADAWCRPTPNGARAGACYVTLKSSGDDRLVSASSARASDLQIHEMKTQNGMMTMGELKDGLPLPAGEAVALSPGGVHLMLMELTQPLLAGDQVPLTLVFDQAPSLVLTAE
ncbi:hypothetical protein LTR94_026855, partial [Friedmanniomyces endolithicus]